MRRHVLRTTLLDIAGPGGKHVTLSQLPPHGHKCASVRQQLLVVAAVRQGMLTFAEACERYNLDLEEYLSWHRSFEDVWPVRQTKIERYRQ
jgi:hypothetical protein